MYTAQGEGQITLGDIMLIVTKRICYFLILTKGFATLIIHRKFQPLAFITF